MIPKTILQHSKKDFGLTEKDIAFLLDFKKKYGYHKSVLFPKKHGRETI